MALQTITSAFRHHPRYTCTQRQRELSHLISVHDSLSPSLNLMYLTHSHYINTLKSSSKHLHSYLILGSSIGRCMELNSDAACMKSLVHVMEEYEHYALNNVPNTAPNALPFKVKRPLPASIYLDQSINAAQNQSKLAVQRLANKTYVYEWLLFPSSSVATQSYTIVVATLCKLLERVYARFADYLSECESQHLPHNAALFELFLKLDRRFKQAIFDPLFSDLVTVTHQSIDQSIMQLVNQTFVDDQTQLLNNPSHTQQQYHTIPNLIKQDSLNHIPVNE